MSKSTMTTLREWTPENKSAIYLINQWGDFKRHMRALPHQAITIDEEYVYIHLFRNEQWGTDIYALPIETAKMDQIEEYNSNLV